MRNDRRGPGSYRVRIRVPQESFIGFIVGLDFKICPVHVSIYDCKQMVVIPALAVTIYLRYFPWSPITSSLLGLSSGRGSIAEILFIAFNPTFFH